MIDFSEDAQHAAVPLLAAVRHLMTGHEIHVCEWADSEELEFDYRWMVRTEATSSGDPIRIKFNPALLADPFRRWGVSEIEMELADNMSPGMFRAGSHEYVLMTMRIQ